MKLPIKMKIGKFLIISALIIFLVETALPFEMTYCCEKTISGAWCQNAPAEQCNPNYLKAATSCEATSYCKLGCCFNNEEGTCSKNTPESICIEDGGIWRDSADCSIPQCELGCCLIGDQAAFVSLTRCKRLASLYGLDINFRQDIGNELSCLLSTIETKKGACVFEREFERTCEFITKKECDSKTNLDGEVEFYENLLCSNEDLNTICGPSERTTCVEGKDEVYFLDSCGNIANIYDSSRKADSNYWNEVISPSLSCSSGVSNANSKICGNCDYYLGSVCKEYTSGNKPVYGNYICADLSCNYNGKQ
jgi:hypothetical protein